MTRNAPRRLVVVVRVRGGGCAGSKEAPATDASPPAPRDRASSSTFVQDISAAVSDDEALEELRRLDDGLVAALLRGDIRLVRTSWLRATPAGYVLQDRRALEELERQLPEHNRGESPLLTNEEAVKLIRCADRRVAVLSHGWLTAGHCDPDAARVAVVVRALTLSSHLQALFWDYARCATGLEPTRSPPPR